jgi:hypothetical protein
MKNIFYRIVLMTLIFVFTSCGFRSEEKCVDLMVEDGYELEEAQERCEDARIESQIHE